MNENHGPPRDSSVSPADRPGRFGSLAGYSSAFVAGIGICALVIVLLLAFAGGPAPLTERDVRAAVGRALASQVPGPAWSALVYDAIRPSLVLVRTDRPESEDAGEDDVERGVGLGSAVVVSAAGHVLTALHVVEGSAAIELTFADGSTSPAVVSLAQPENDIAVLIAEQPPATLVPAVLGNPGSLRIGSEAYIVGHPYGLVGSLSSGVISGLERTFRRPRSDLVLTGLIQVDAAVNPGNSGGPLLDRRGHVMGIVTALLNPTQDDVFIGIGLAVPIDAAASGAGLPPY